MKTTKADVVVMVDGEIVDQFGLVGLDFANDVDFSSVAAFEFTDVKVESAGVELAVTVDEMFPCPRPDLAIARQGSRLWQAAHPGRDIVEAERRIAASKGMGS